MLNKNFGLAPLTVGSILMLLGPAVVSARDRDDNHQGYESRFDSHDRRYERDSDRRMRQEEHERLEHRRSRGSDYTNGYYSYSNDYSQNAANGYRSWNGYWVAPQSSATSASFTVLHVLSQRRA